MTSYNNLIVVDKKNLESVIQKELTRVKNGDYKSYSFKSRFKKLEYTDFNEATAVVEFKTAEWLFCHPFNRWDCGIIYENVDFLSDNIKMEDIRYAITRTRPQHRKGDVQEYETHPNEDTILTINAEKGLYFKGVWVNFVDHSKMNNQERSELFDTIYNICF